MSKNSTDSNLSRKSFLKYTGATAIGTAVSGFTSFKENKNEPLDDGALGTFKSSEEKINSKDIVIENKEMRLVISPKGIGKSLVYKPTNAECLMQGVDVPAFSMVQDHPYSGKDRANLIPLERHEFLPNSVSRKDNTLIVGFDIVDIHAIIDLKIKSHYIQVNIKGFAHGHNIKVKGETENVTPTAPQVDEMWFLRLPIRNGNHFGEWLNVMWDDQLAVNVLGTDPYARIVSEKRDGYRILKAGMCDIKGVKSEGTGAGLIATPTDKLLDTIGEVEADFDLPHGAKNRNRKLANMPLFKTSSITPKNVDQYIEYAQKTGIQAFQIFYPAFAKTVGHFEWREEYPNGMKDLQEVVNKIKKAGMIPGIHLHYNKASKNDTYVSPVPDSRFNIRQYFTLSASLNKNGDTIFVEEYPGRVTLHDGRRLLKIGKELISYTNYSSDSQPYKFTGCTRGAIGTEPATHPKGEKFGLLDVDTWTKFVRFDQQTSLQQEVAERIADMYQKAGFEFVYLDGAEDINAPYWFNCSKSQWEVYRRLKPEPIFSGGAAMSHFSWHMLSRGNSWDKWKPGIVKQATKNYPQLEAPLMWDNFTRSAFGWIGYYAPGKYKHQDHTVGTQPDMLEYVISRATGWHNSPYILTGDVETYDEHPRTPDNLEVVRRWNKAREQDWFTEQQKKMLRSTDQEHILLGDEQKKFELVPYEQIKIVPKGVRAFIFERKNNLYVVYWHTAGNKKLKLPVKPEDIRLYEELGQKVNILSDQPNDSAVLPVSGRRYVETNKLTKGQLKAAFQHATLID